MRNTVLKNLRKLQIYKSLALNKFSLTRNYTYNYNKKVNPIASTTMHYNYTQKAIKTISQFPSYLLIDNKRPVEEITTLFNLPITGIFHNTNISTQILKPFEVYECGNNIYSVYATVKTLILGHNAKK